MNEWGAHRAGRRWDRWGGIGGDAEELEWTEPQLRPLTAIYCFYFTPNYYQMLICHLKLPGPGGETNRCETSTFWSPQSTETCCTVLLRSRLIVGTVGVHFQFKLNIHLSPPHIKLQLAPLALALGPPLWIQALCLCSTEIISTQIPAHAEVVLIRSRNPEVWSPDDENPAKAAGFDAVTGVSQCLNPVECTHFGKPDTALRLFFEPWWKFGLDGKKKKKIILWKMGTDDSCHPVRHVITHLKQWNY